MEATSQVTGGSVSSSVGVGVGVGVVVGGVVVSTSGGRGSSGKIEQSFSNIWASLSAVKQEDSLLAGMA